MLSWMGRTTLEILGQAGLGHSFDPLTEDLPDEFATAVKDFLWVALQLSIQLRDLNHNPCAALKCSRPSFCG